MNEKIDLTISLITYQKNINTNLFLDNLYEFIGNYYKRFIKVNKFQK